MIITCVSECTKAAFPRTQRVLSKYLPQIGRRTWQGALSHEALMDMIDALKNDIHTRHKKVKLGKNASVAIYRNRGYSETQLLTVIGNRYAFSDEGRYCFSVRKTGATTHSSLSHWNQLLRVCVRLAGLLHDLGKATSGFQTKLSVNSPKSDPIRHEVISWALIASLLDRTAEAEESEEDYWLAALATPEKISAYFSGQIANLAKNLDKAKLINIHRQACFSAPLLYGISWLILSHHRLPSSVKDNFFFGLKDSDQNFQPHLWLAGCDLEDENVKAFLTIDAESPALPWRQKAWLDAVTSCVERIAELKRQSETDPTPLLAGFNLLTEFPPRARFWFSALYHHLRPVLASADYLASADKKTYRQDPVNSDSLRQLPENQQIFANKLSYQWADSLTEHLLKVSRWSYKLFNQLEQWQTAMPDWQSLSDYELPRKLSSERLEANLAEGKESRIRCDERFRWQQELRQLLVAERFKQKTLNAESHLAGFGVMVAETGSGKTIGAITAITAATGRARLTTALGFRSLTRQTANSYRQPQEVGLKPHHVATLIGASIEKQMQEQNKRDNEAEDGTENAISDLTEFSWERTDFFDGETHPLCSLGSASLKPMLQAPIVVATTDHLVHALEGSRAAQLLPIYRIATADTLLDELDSYSNEDLISLVRWAYVCGYYGRSLWLVSATLPKATAQMFAEHYYAGLAAFQLRTGKTVNIINGLSANRGKQHVFTLNPNQIDEFNRRYSDDFLKPVERVITQSAMDFPRHRLCFLPISDEPLKAGSLKTIAGQIGWFHQQHCLDIIFEGRRKKISIGAVMFDRVIAAQQGSLWLSACLPDEFKIVCYHARFTGLDRLLLEYVLEPLLNRKQSERWQRALGKNPDIVEHLRRHDELCLTVCTTNILETGRDFDFDWACADLLSVRSLIQLAGRVKRHRYEITEQPNIALFYEPGSYAERLMRRVNRTFADEDEQALLLMKNQQRLGTLFEQDILHSAPLLSPDEYCALSPYLAHQHKQQATLFEHLNTLLHRSGYWLNHYLATEFRFRKSAGKQIIVAWKDDEPVWQNGEYLSDSGWHSLDFLPLTLSNKICTSANSNKLTVQSARLAKGLLSNQFRRQLWDELNLDSLPASLLHHISLSYKPDAATLFYSSDLGLYDPFSLDKS